MLYTYITECLNVYFIFQRKSLKHSATTGKIAPSMLKHDPDQERPQIIMALLRTEVLLPHSLSVETISAGPGYRKFTGVLFQH